MKKKLEAELISIAHRILQLSNRSDVSQLQEEARLLYEKLTILNFSESHFSEPQPTVISQVHQVLEEIAPTIEETITEATQPKPSIPIDEIPEIRNISEKKPSVIEEIIKPEKLEIEEEKPEIFIEKINEKISEDLFIPASAVVTEKNISFSEPVYEKNDKENIGSEEQTMPILDTKSAINQKPISLNEQLKKGIHIGLNDRLAFIKHLFNGSAADYNRVLSQLNTLHSKSGAKQFIKNMVKPDYNNWTGKEEYEERFMEIVTNKFEF